MQTQESLKMHGSMTAVLVKADGSTETRFKDNMIVNVGFDFIADSIGKSASRPAVMNAIALGTNSTAAASTNTLLGAELVRQAATYAHTAGTKTFTMSVTFADGVGTGAITEAGVFNSTTANAGTMLDRVVFAVINKGSADTLTVTFTFTMA